MKNNVTGHQYELSNFENKDQQGQILQFIHKEPKEEGSTELVTISDGTTNEDVINVLIERFYFLQKKNYSSENATIILLLKNIRRLLALRFKRKKENVERYEEDNSYIRKPV